MMAAEKKKSQKPPVDGNEEWKALREGWAAVQVSRAHAHLLAKFDTDEEMPLSVSYTHLRAHETVLDLVCRLLLEKKKKNKNTHGNTLAGTTDTSETEVTYTEQ